MPMEFYCKICGGKSFQYSAKGIPKTCRERNFCHPTPTGKCCHLPKGKREECPNWRVFQSSRLHTRPDDKNKSKRNTRMSF